MLKNNNANHTFTYFFAIISYYHHRFYCRHQQYQHQA